MGCRSPRRRSRQSGRLSTGSICRHQDTLICIFIGLFLVNLIWLNVALFDQNPMKQNPIELEVTVTDKEDGNGSVSEIMKRKLKTLPTPPWPQLDLRTATAISNGIIVGPPAPPNLTTLVSAYYQFESKHGVGQYETWFKRLLRTSDPLIIFLEPGSIWEHFVVERRSHAPTIVVPHPFSELVMSTSFTESFWEEQHAIDLEAKIHKGSGVYKIWNEKLIFIHAAMDLNPFNSPTFTWIDAGYFRNDGDSKEGEPVVRLDITQAGVPTSKVLLLHVRNDSLELTGKGRVATAGNSFTGTPEAFYDMYDKYYLTFWDWVVNKLFIGSDQFVMSETCYRYPSVCYPYFPGRFKNWFAMAALLGKSDFDISTKFSTKFPFGSAPGTKPPPFPSSPISTSDGWL
mmetsp:Transcript_2852/g.4490  ORF Transcript_2852/g.4490 Transcript_2852/m.4490 type:complete len:400 (+) Transcript_2852:3-1202(+)